MQHDLLQGLEKQKQVVYGYRRISRLVLQIEQKDDGIINRLTSLDSGR